MGYERLERAPPQDKLEAYVDRCVALYGQVAPNFRASILHRDVVGPHELEHDYGVIGGQAARTAIGDRKHDSRHAMTGRSLLQRART